MNGKMNQSYGDDASLETDVLNPFTHRLELSTTYDKIKTAIFTVVILPFRVAAICGLLIIAWWLASIGLYGLSEHELRTKPMSGWRKDAKVIVCIIMRALFAAGGFHWVTVKGKQATSKQAPVLAVAPHSSYFDALTVVYLGGPSVVAKGETGTLPIFGRGHQSPHSAAPLQITFTGGTQAETLSVAFGSFLAGQNILCKSLGGRPVPRSVKLCPYLEIPGGSCRVQRGETKPSARTFLLSDPMEESSKHITVLVSSGVRRYVMCSQRRPLAEERMKNIQVLFQGSKKFLRKFREYIAIAGQLTYRVGGMSIVVKGRQATRQEAPILVIAPHSTFLDAVIVYVTGFPSIITRWESGLNPWLGKLINYTQPVYVWRDDHDSRQNTIKEIIERANSDLDWPQVLIFPEGTCTNRSCLITFKSGAFYPGVPVQPVCIRYPNKLDTVTWTWEGPGVLKLLWLTLTQVHSCCEIEFLPVYKPNIDEKNDPRLYANNVRKLMAKALGVPVSNYTYDDCRLMTRAKQMKLPCAGKLVEIQKLRQTLGLTKTNEEENIIAGDDWKSLRVSQKVSYDQFIKILKLSSSDPAASHLFKLFDKDALGVIDFREYLLTILVISKSSNLSELLYFVFKVMDEEGEGHIKEYDFCKIVYRILSVSVEQCSSIFNRIDTTKRGYITFNEFRDFAMNRKEFANVFKSSDNVKTKSE